MNRCPKCDEYIYESSILSHKCHPIFLVWESENDETDAREVRAFDEESAAEKWAEEDDCNSAEYDIISGNDVEVTVKAPDGTIKKFKVSGESVPQYHADEVE